MLLLLLLLSHSTYIHSSIVKTLIDKARITVKAGNGGGGCVGFRREKYIPKGGPDGGDGGDGGDIIIQVQPGQHMLREFRYKRIFHAGDGKAGQGNNKTGHRGQ